MDLALLAAVVDAEVIEAEVAEVVTGDVDVEPLAVVQGEALVVERRSSS